MSSRHICVAVVQTTSELGDLAINISRTQMHVADAARQGAQLVVLPECMNSGYLYDDRAHAWDLSEPVDGPYCQALADMCRQHGIYIGAGLTERGDDGLIYNTAVLLDPQGQLIGHYRKQFLPAQDQLWFAVGDLGNPVIETPLGKIGLLVCFDGRIPEVARCLAAQGAEIILDMANFFVMGQADMFVPARAMENGVWLLAATKSGIERSIYYPGGSMIVAPSGEVVARVPNDTHGVAVANIELPLATQARWADGELKWAGRQAHAYGLLNQAFEDTPLAQCLGQSITPESHCVKVAPVQAHCDPIHDIMDVVEAARHAALLGVKLIVLPLHVASPSAQPTREQAQASVTQVPALTQQLQALCADHGCHVVLPTIERHDRGHWPCAVLIGPDGIVGQQRQVHQSTADHAWATYPAQNPEFTVFDTPIGRIGMLLGPDGLYPESTRVLALMGAELITWSSAWSHPDERRLMAVTKAVDNRVYLVCANRQDAPHPGGSFVIAPHGFPHWDVNHNAAPNPRWGAVMPMFAERAVAQQKCMEPGVDMLRNRLPHTYEVLTHTLPATGLPTTPTPLS